MLADQLAAIPTNIMTSAEYQQTFYPISFQTLQLESRIVGIPLMYDGLALFYNKEMLRNANLSVPTTWSELRGVANQLTVPGNVSTRRDDNITQAGLAIGNASNVDHFADILALLILQNGGDPTVPTSQNVIDALTFYTNFIKQDKVWSNNLPSSTLAFARGEVAMIFAPSWRALDVIQINPELDFAVAQVPQLSNEENISWATFWAEGVYKISSKQEAAWKLLKYLSSPEVLRKFHNNAV
jgi:multiple sugar transport system substrate-binding protein